eukprot:2131956-Amphidinium_carterae.3
MAFCCRIRCHSSRMKMSDPLGFSSTKCRPAPSWSSTTEAVNLLHAMPFAWLRAQSVPCCRFRSVEPGPPRKRGTRRCSN